MHCRTAQDYRTIRIVVTPATKQLQFLCNHGEGDKEFVFIMNLDVDIASNSCSTNQFVNEKMKLHITCNIEVTMVHRYCPHSCWTACTPAPCTLPPVPWTLHNPGRTRCELSCRKLCPPLPAPVASSRRAWRSWAGRIPRASASAAACARAPCSGGRFNRFWML